MEFGDGYFFFGALRSALFLGEAAAFAMERQE